MTGLAIVLILLVLILLIGLIAFVAFRSGLIDKWRATRLRPAQAEDEIAPPSSLGTATSIALAELRSRTAAASDIRDVPWALVLGAEGPALEALLPPDHPPRHRVSWLTKSGVERAGFFSFREGGVVLGCSRGLVDSPDRAVRLVELLRRVETARPGRPIDSLVLTVPAALLQGDPEDPAVRDRVQAYGRNLYELVLAAQSRTGWRVPLYLLVTGSEAIEGFAETAGALLAHSSSPMLGWASPRPIDSSFELGWTADAFATIARDLLVAQCHLLMGLADADRARAALRFPDRLAALKPAVGLLLEQLLHESAYHEGFMLRGLFLTGDTPGAAPQPRPLGGADEAATPHPPAPPAPQPLAAALFRDKVFPEHGLAQPASGERTRRHRMVRRTQLALAGTLVAFATGISLLMLGGGETLIPVRNVLDKVNKQQGLLQPVDCRKLQADGRQQQSATDLLQGLASIQVDRLESYLAPTSFFTNATGHVREAIATSLRRIVFVAVVEQMATPAGIQARLAADLPDTRDASYWPAFVDKVRAFDTHYTMLESLTKSEQAKADITRRFGTVASYALGQSLPDLVGYDALYADAIARQSIPCVNREQTVATVRQQISKHYQATVKAWYGNDPLVTTITAIDRDFGTIGAFAPVAGLEPRPAAAEMLERLRHLYTLLDAVTRALPGAAEAPWMSPPGAPRLPELAKLRNGLVDNDTLDNIASSHRAEATDWILRIRGARLAEMPLLALAAPMAAPAANAPPATSAPPGVADAPTMSESATATRNLLRELMAQPFFQTRNEDALRAAGPFWDVARLQSIEQLAKGYLGFRSKAPALVPEPVLMAAAQAVRTRAGRYIAVEALSSSQATDGTGAAKASNFLLALPRLQSIRLMLREFGELEGAVAIGQRINSQAGKIFEEANTDLASDGGPYAVDRAALAGWRGQGSLAATAFATGTIENLQATLAQRRAWVAQIARARVAPVVAYVLDPTNGAQQKLIADATRWQRILQALEGYDAGPNPNNPITRLEHFMTVDIDRLQAQGCAGLSKVAATPRGYGDYFANQQLRISADVFPRCRDGVLADLRARYTRVRDAFEAELAGRFPFGPPDAPDADPALVRGFFQRQGATIAALRVALEDIRIAAPAAAAALGDLAAAQDALAPMLAGATAPLSYTVGVRFFTDPQAALGQDQVIEAMLGTPLSRAATSGTGQFLWRTGEPLVARFRWAANAPSLPLSGLAVAGGACLPAPDGAWANSRTGGAWALLRLLRRQGTDLREAAAASGYPVAFDVALCANLRSAVGGDAPAPRARLLVRLTLAGTPSAPDKPAPPLTLPDFPSTLPPLPGARPRR